MTLAAPIAIDHCSSKEKTIKTIRTIRQKSQIYPLGIVEVEKEASQTKLLVGPLERILGQTKEVNKTNPLITPPQPASMPPPSRKIKRKVKGPKSDSILHLS